MKGHTVAHSGQYQCQQCKRMFKTLGTLDDHIKNYHNTPKPTQYKCEQCDSTFDAQHKLRQYSLKKHILPPQGNQLRLNSIIHSSFNKVKLKERTDEVLGIIPEKSISKI